MKKRNYILPFILLFLFAVAINFTSCGKKGDTKPAPVPPVALPPAQTTPPKDPVVVADTIKSGVNLQPSYYNDGMPNFAWDLMKKQSKIKTLRIEIEPDKVEQAKTWIKEAKENGYQVIATYHKYKVLGSDDEQDLLDAANWWKTNYAALGGDFIINLMNEWGSHNISAPAYATAYNNAIAIVRTVYKDAIIIDIPGWGQETYTAYQACKTSSPIIADTNIILSAHIYSNGWNQGRNHNFQASDLDDISKSGRRGFIGEFGNGGGGSVDWSGCIDSAKAKGWGVIGWCWNGDGGDMNMVDPSWAKNSSATSFSTNSYFTIIYDKL
jgi:mannan endo-1,4-beta-mannosidase